MLRVWLFGKVRFQVDDGKIVTPEGEPAQRLLAYLALKPGEMTDKSQVSVHIWDTKVDDSFKKALKKLTDAFERSSPGNDQLRTPDGRRERAQIGLVGEVWVDALEFNRVWESEPAAALRLAERPFLADIQRVGPRLGVRRDQFTVKTADARSREALRMWASGQRDAALSLAETAHADAPDHPPAVEALMELYARDGHARAAIELGAKFVVRQGPGEATGAVDELVERIRAGELPRDRDSGASGASPRAVAGATTTSAPARRRTIVVAAAIVGVLAIVVIAALTLASGGEDSAGSDRAFADCDAEALTAPSEADLGAVEVGGSPPPGRTSEIVTRSMPRAIAAASDGIWLAQSTDGSVWRIDPKLEKPIGQPFPVGGTPYQLAIARKAIWVSRDDGVLVQLNRDTGEIERKVRYGPIGAEVALGAGYVWLNIYEGKRGGSVAKVDPCTGNVEYLSVGKRANTVAFGFDHVWVTDSLSKAVYRVDPETGVADEIALDVSDPQDLGVGDGSIWVAHYGPQRLTRIDPERVARVGEPIEIGPGAAAVEVGAGAAWIPTYEGDGVSRVDLDSLASDPEAAKTGVSPTDITLGHGALWVPNNDSEPPTVTRIDL